MTVLETEEMDSCPVPVFICHTGEIQKGLTNDNKGQRTHPGLVLVERVRTSLPCTAKLGGDDQ